LEQQFLYNSQVIIAQKCLVSGTSSSITKKKANLELSPLCRPLPKRRCIRRIVQLDNVYIAHNIITLTVYTIIIFYIQWSSFLSPLDPFMFFFLPAHIIQFQSNLGLENHGFKVELYTDNYYFPSTKGHLYSSLLSLLLPHTIMMMESSKV